MSERTGSERALRLALLAQGAIRQPLASLASRMAERVGVLRPASRNPNETGLFRLSRTTAAIYRLRILSSAFVYLRPFAGFASTMTLEMSLAAKDFASSHVRGSSETSRHRTARVDRRGSSSHVDLPKAYAGTTTYSANDVDTGTGCLSSMRPSTCSWIASYIRRSVSSRVAPVATQPGKSGE